MNGTSLPVNSVTRVRSSGTAAEGEALFICRSPRLWLRSESLLRRMHTSDLQAQNPERRAAWRLGGRDWIEDAQT